MNNVGLYSQRKKIMKEAFICIFLDMYVSMTSAAGDASDAGGA